MAGASGSCSALTARRPASAATHAAQPTQGAPTTSSRQRRTRGRLLGPLAAASGLVVVLLVACSSGSLLVRGQSYLPATMIDAMEAALFLNKFLDASDVTGWYDKFLEPSFSGTVFAPVDQGFDALLAKANATWDDMLSASMNDTLAAIVGLHVVPGPQPLFPLSDVRDGQPLATATGRDIYLRRDVPGITHVYAVERPELDPLNFGTVLQYQEIRGGKAILYVIDKPLVPPADTAAAPQPQAATYQRRRGPSRKAHF